MSLFGDEGESPKPKNQSTSSTLFKDAKQASNGGLFGDDADPWIPTPKKKRDPSQILAKSDIPDAYVDLYERYATNGQMSSITLSAVLKDANLASGQQDTIKRLASIDNDGSVPRNTFNLVLVLIALAQQNVELSLDLVDDLKTKRLPVPDLVARSATNDDVSSQGVNATPELKQTTLDSFVSAEDAGSSPATAQRSRTPIAHSRADNLNDPWSPNGSTHAASYVSRDALPVRSYVSSPKVQSGTDIDTITIKALDGKEGMPLWKHINYEVKSTRRKSQVVRRYSDFAWLLECLLKKYPFRQIPLLPPKKIAGMNFTGKTADLGFLEKRRRGLSRFVNAIERHPIFKTDQLVTTFLTVPTELAVWRKQASVTVSEEFDDRYLPIELEGSLPSGIDAWIDKTDIGLRNAIDCFTQLTTLQERIIKRQEADCVDRLRFSASLNFFSEQETPNFNVLGHENGSGIMRGLQSISKHSSNAQELMHSECRAWDDNYLEDLKRYRGILVAMKEMFVRHVKLSGDDVPGLEKRIASSTAKLEALNAKVDAKDADKDKLRVSIENDKQGIVKAKNRRVFIKECVWHELQYFEAQQVHISKMANDMANTNLEYAKRYMDVATTLVGDVESMP